MMEDTLASLLEKVNANLANASYYYLSNDPERAIGLEDRLKNYHIVHIDQSQIADILNNNKIETFCLQLAESDDVFRSSIKLVRSQEFSAYFNRTRKQQNYIQTFKISPAFEMAVRELGATLMNTSADLNRLFENKLSQYNELSTLQISLPKTRVASLTEYQYDDLVRELGNPFVVQFDRGHTGSGTVFVSEAETYKQLQQQFPARQVKFSQYIEGTAYTLNACVLRQGVVMGGLSKQITGIQQLTPQAGATIGNDWSDHRDFTNGLDNLIKEVTIIGEHMRSKGYLGLFGLDIMVKPDGQHVFIEINARQPASIPMYTKIQLADEQIPLSLLHIAEFLGISYQLNVAGYNQRALAEKAYSQIFVRALKDEQIRTQIPTGYYRLQGDNAAINRETQEVRPNTIFLDEERDKALLFMGQNYDINAVDNAGMVLLTPVAGRKIKPNEEIGRIQLKQGAFANATSLKPWIIEALVAVREYQI